LGVRVHFDISDKFNKAVLIQYVFLVLLNLGFQNTAMDLTLTNTI
jgi:hypothetical protein